MSTYVDSSILVTALTGEVRADEMQAWLSAQPAIFASWWTDPEFASAVARKTREKILDRRGADLAGAALRHLIASNFIVLPVRREDFERARDMVRSGGVALRASDALHLAVAAAHGLELVTLDKRMASGGAAVGVATLLL